MAGRIAVRTELVKEFLVDRILEEVSRRRLEDLPPATEEALARSHAPALARSGYLARAVETAMFDAARGPTPGLAEKLDGGSITDVAAELAAAEPLEKPSPDDPGWTSWRVPGPGGHVRHYAALAAVRAHAPELREALGGRTLKEAWMYGFYVRCCEEALAADGPA